MLGVLLLGQLLLFYASVKGPVGQTDIGFFIPRSSRLKIDSNLA
jgi:hypothetical protein